MTKEEEDGFIHGLLELAKNAPKAYDIGNDGRAALGYKPGDVSVLIDRLQFEGLAQVDFGSSVVLTVKGLDIARGTNGYRGYQQQQLQKTRRDSIKEWYSAWGSLLGGIAGVASFFFSGYTYWRTTQDTKQNESATEQIAKRVTSLEQAQKATQHEVHKKTLALPVAKDTLHHTKVPKLTKPISSKASTAESTKSK